MLNYNLTLSIVMLIAGLAHTWLFGSLTRGRVLKWFAVAVMSGVGAQGASVAFTCAIYLGLFLVGIGTGKWQAYQEQQVAKRCYQETTYQQGKLGG